MKYAKHLTLEEIRDAAGGKKPTIKIAGGTAYSINTLNGSRVFDGSTKAEYVLDWLKRNR